MNTTTGALPADLGESIRRLRTVAGLTQKQLADAVGVAQTTVSEWEQGRSAPRRTHLRLVAGALNVHVSTLLTEWAA